MKNTKQLSSTYIFINYLRKKLASGVPMSKLSLEEYQKETGDDMTPLTFRTYVGRARQGTGPIRWLTGAQRKMFANLLDRKKAGGWLRDPTKKQNRNAPVHSVHPLAISLTGKHKTDAVAEYVAEHPGAPRREAEAALGTKIASSTYHEAKQRAKRLKRKPAAHPTKQVVSTSTTIFQSIVTIEGTLNDETYKLLESLVDGISKFTGNKFQVETTARPKPLIRINATVGK